MKMDLIVMVAKQIIKVNTALTDEGWDRQSMELIGMQKALRTILPMEEYNEVIAKAEKLANH